MWRVDGGQASGSVVAGVEVWVFVLKPKQKRVLAGAQGHVGDVQEGGLLAAV